MIFNYETGSAKDSQNHGLDTVLSNVILIAAMIPVGCQKCFSQPLVYANFCPQFNAASESSLSFPHLSTPGK
jgi:hypothetical protein